jgi:Zn-dependent protease with chaperone function
MTTTLRAALSVVMLLGFYVVTLGIIGGLGFVTFLLFATGHGGAGAAKLGFLTLAAGVGVLVALWRVLTAKATPPPGPVVTPDQAPQLWQTLRELAAAAGTRAPDEIRLIPEVNAAVSEDSRMLGLIGGRRRLFLGIPLMQAFTVAQLRSVLAHELGHYSRKHTSLGAIAYRGREAIVATLSEMSGIIAFLLRQYAKVYVLVSAAVSRRQELEADELSVRVAGRATAQGALKELPVIDAAWGFYQSRYLAPGLESGLAPLSADLFGGFGEMLAARTDELARLRNDPPPTESSKWDSHPSIAVRVAAMEAMPDAVVAVDTRPATDLIPWFDRHSENVASVIDFEGHTRLPWDQFSTASTLVQEQRQADLVYRAAARLTGGNAAGLAAVFGLVEAGRLGELAAEFFPNVTPQEARAQFVEPMELLLRVAAVRSDVATWRHRWVGAPALVARSGAPIDLTEIATLAIAPETLPEARARLAALGIEVERAVLVDKVATAHGGDIIGGLANVELNGAPHDLLVLDNGLILAPCPKKTEGGKNRMIMLAQSAPVVEIAKANFFIPLEEVAQAVIVKRTPLRVELTMRNGNVLRIFEKWSGERLSRDSDDALVAVLQPFLTQPTKA